MPTAIQVITPTVVVAGAEITAASQRRLLEVHIESRMNAPGRCTIRYNAVELDGIEHATAPGTTVDIKLGAQLLFSGEVIAAEVERGSEPLPTTTLVAYDLSNRLSLLARTHTWQDATPSTVLSELAQDCKLSLDAEHLPTDKMPYLLQAGSGLELLDDITLRTGTEWWVAGTKLVVRKPDAEAGPAVEVPLRDLHRFAVRASANRPDTVVVRGWNSIQQQAIESQATLKASPKAATGTLADKYLTAGWAGGQRQHQVSSLPVETVEEAKTLADALTARAAAGAVHAEGEGTGLGALALGQVLRIVDGGSLTGSYVVTRLEHRWAPTQALTTRFVCGDRRPPGIGVAAPGARPATDSYSGIVIGEVTNINDPDKRGRVRVRFVGLDPNEESNWARVVIPGGGAERGAVALPEVGDEVVVGFEAGDLRRPIVLGGLFGSAKKIPIWQVADGKVTARRTTSRLGHFLEFGDGTKPAEEHLLLSFKDAKTKLRLGKDKVELLAPSGVPVSITAGSQSSIVFDGHGKVTLNGTTIEIKASQKLVLEGLQVEGSAKTAMKLASNGTAELTASATAKVVASGPLQLQGAIVKIN